MDWVRVRLDVAHQLIGPVWPDESPQIVEVGVLPPWDGYFVTIRITYVTQGFGGSFEWGLHEDEMGSFDRISEEDAAEGIATRARIDLMEHLSERAYEKRYGRPAP